MRLTPFELELIGKISGLCGTLLNALPKDAEYSNDHTVKYAFRVAMEHKEFVRVMSLADKE
jgi:hypothetical protein